LFGAVSAQYFSAGWAPGQPVQQESATEWSPNQGVPRNAQPRQQTSFDWTKLLTDGPVGSLFEKAGINITKNIEDAALKEANRWDKRIPLITDDNYDNLVVNETLTEEEEKERIWFIVITTAKGQTGHFSEMVDTTFDAAYNATVNEDDLKNVRWGRIDYVDVTALTTKWGVWQGPRIVVVSERGRTLRFFKPSQVTISIESTRGFLQAERWKQEEPWATSWAPGGSNEWIMDWFAWALSKYYNAISSVPKWLLLITTGSAGTLIINLIHKNEPAPAKQRPVQQAPTATVQATPSKPAEAAGTSSGTPTTKSKGKQRKGKK